MLLAQRPVLTPSTYTGAPPCPSTLTLQVEPLSNPSSAIRPFLVLILHLESPTHPYPKRFPPSLTWVHLCLGQVLGPLGLGQKGRAPGSGQGHAPPPLLPPWAPEEALHFLPVLMLESSRLLAPGPQLASVGAADSAGLGVPLGTEGGEESGHQRQDETAAENYSGQSRLSGECANSAP